MRRTASEKMEIIGLVEGTDLPVRATLRQLGVPPSTFYGWYQRYQLEGFDGLHDQKPAPRPRWHAIPRAIQDEVLNLALERTDLSPRELACHYTDEERYFVSESSVYRILKKADLITSPAYVLMSASGAFKHPTTRVHEMWQTDFTYFRIINWGWYGVGSGNEAFLIWRADARSARGALGRLARRECGRGPIDISQASQLLEGLWVKLAT